MLAAWEVAGAGAQTMAVIRASFDWWVMVTNVNLTVVGADCKGVVARVTNHLFEIGANIEAIEERVRRREFRMMLQATFDDAPDIKRLRRSLNALGKDLGMEIRMRAHLPRDRKRLGIFVTKETHCLDAIMAASRSGKLGLDPVFVLSNRKDLAPLAESHGLPFHYVPWGKQQVAERRVLQRLETDDIDLIALARFMRILSPDFCWRYPNRIVNVHPSLLPSFPGASAYRQAWEHGVRVTGATAHFVTPDLDQGPILAQKSVPVKRDDSVEEVRDRGQLAEADVLVDALRMCVREDLDVHWGRVW